MEHEKKPGIVDREEGANGRWGSTKEDGFVFERHDGCITQLEEGGV